MTNVLSSPSTTAWPSSTTTVPAGPPSKITHATKRLRTGQITALAEAMTL
jgi:hypothetical protein